MPKISIIIPSYNYAHYLQECVESIIKQTFTDWEAIIVDDGSTDDTQEIASSITALDPARIKYHRIENGGVSNARNYALERSSGEFILPLDADDVLFPGALESYLRCIEQDKDIGFAYCVVLNFGEEDQDNKIWDPGEFNKERFLWENLAACTSIWRREFYTRGIKYRDVIFEDWDLWLQMLATGCRAGYIARPLFGYRLHHSGRSAVNNYRYLQALIQLINLNPSLYEPGLVEWSKLCMKNYPQCLELPSILFLPYQNSSEFKNLSADLMQKAKNYIEEGYFVAALGDYRNTSEFIPGLIYLNYSKGFSRERLLHETSRLGKEVIVYSGCGEELDEEILNCGNVADLRYIQERAKKNETSKTEISVSELPKISVITVSYNQAEFICKNIESVLRQNYPNFEHIVIDGGSTDGTIEILESYPHLNWLSEPDRGQTHALNKGFAKASGDIIAWLNSDDWYPDNVFNEVARALKKESIVIGACQVTDKAGNPTQHVSNIGRNWFDVLKYWIYFSSPAQPSIFFKRHILEEFKISDGKYLDEGLEFCMDYEFWLRIGKKYPLKTHIPRVLSYCRTYDSNKTGRDMDSAYREMSRVFSRYSRNSNERAVSFVLPVTTVEADLNKTIESIVSQNLLDFEILIADYCENEKAAKGNRRKVIDLEKQYPFINIRYFRSIDTSYIETLNNAFSAAAGEFLVLLHAGSIVSSTFCFETKNLMRHDIIGMALPSKGQDNFRELIRRREDGRNILNIENIFNTPWIAPYLVIRKIAWQDICGIKDIKTDNFLVQELILKLMYRGWQVSVDNKLEILLPALAQENIKNEKVAELANIFAAKAITEIHELLEEDDFAKLRAENGFALIFSEDLVENSGRLLAGYQGSLTQEI